jgi:hypothetical protein
MNNVGQVAINEGGSVAKLWQNGKLESLQELCGSQAPPLGKIVSMSDNTGIILVASGNKYRLLLPVDIDFIHPATGEMNESRETSEGGYIAIRKDEETPVTKLRLHKLDGMASAEFKLTFSSGKIKIWKDAERTQAVTSNSTVFPANVDTELFLEGVEKSTAAKDIEIGLKVKIGSAESSALTTKATVVQAEYDFTIQAFIPYQWVDIPLIWLLNAFPGGAPMDEVAVGDNRGYDPTLNRTFRARESFVVTPHEDLSPQRIKANSWNNQSARSVHYDKSDSVPANEQNQAHGYNFVAGAQPTRSGDGTAEGFVEQIMRVDSKKFLLRAKHTSFEGVLGPLISVPIAWDFIVTFDMTNAIEARVLLQGTRKGFPAYETYVRDSKDENRALYQWSPPADRGVLSLTTIEPVDPNQPREIQVP